jgi:hypothetical protein
VCRAKVLAAFVAVALKFFLPLAASNRLTFETITWPNAAAFAFSVVCMLMLKALGVVKDRNSIVGP